MRTHRFLPILTLEDIVQMFVYPTSLHIILKLDMQGEDFTVYYGEQEDSLRELCKMDGALINPEKVGCMCGTLLGMFATGNETSCDNEAEFDWFRYQEF